MISFKNYTLLQEGGAGGHMAHPFDLPDVNNGKQLLKKFDQVIKHLQATPAAIKLDGVNAAVKIITNEAGEKEFAMDRGSMKPLDVKGITERDLLDRFGEGHGMVNVGQTLLPILNAVIDTAESELTKLGLLQDQDPTESVFLNIEYIAGKSNVVDYGQNIIALLGVNKFALAPTGKSRRGSEVRYNPKVLESLKDKLQVAARNQDFTVYTSIPGTLPGGVDYSDLLQEPITVQYTPEEAETKSLGVWLNTAINPRDAKVDINGKKQTAMTKSLYFYVMEGQGPLSDLTQDKRAQKMIVYGAIIYHATKNIGERIKENVNSPVDVGEGLVIRGLDKVPFKITGEFIVSGLMTGFR